MRGRVARSAFALGSAGLVVLGIAGCNQSAPEENQSQANLKIVEQVQIDENGAEVKAAEGAAPADPAGDGKATCPPVSSESTTPSPSCEWRTLSPTESAGTSSRGALGAGRLPTPPAGAGRLAA